jgi:hypothetical protein
MLDDDDRRVYWECVEEDLCAPELEENNTFEEF